MNVGDIELMRQLQKRYYQEVRGVGAGRLVRCTHRPIEILFYRLWVVFSLGFIIACFISKF
jgi:hypothetical protein